MSRPRRLLRRLRRRIRPARVDLVWHEKYRLELPATAADAQRGERILTYLASEGLLDRRRLHRPHPAAMRALRRVHVDSYLESLHDPEVVLRIVGLRLTEDQLDAVFDLQRRMTGGTQRSVRLALAGDRVVVNLGGGFHHAFAGRGERFCLIHDVAVAIAVHRARGFAGRVLVVDLDLHDGDGTRALFAEDDTVHTFSIHNETNLTGSPVEVAESTTIELGGEVGDEEYLAAIEEHLPPLVERFAPELVIYLAGADPAASDEIGDWRITPEAMLARDRRVVELARGGETPVALVAVLAGGYGPKAWRYGARFVGWLVAGDRFPEPPSTEEITLARYRALSRLLTPEELTASGQEANGDDWGLTEEDVYGTLAGVARPSRFLGFYSAHGIELALERGGILDRLRGLGYPRPTIELDLDPESGETVRLFGDADGHELLLELRARRDRATLPGFELLRVEWLLLQNPRASFTNRRPRLPGQRHPGLGMVADVTAFLVLACERLGLDGVFFVPSHYHLAAQAKRHLRFLDPEAEGRFRTLRRALKDLPLPDATRTVDEGRLRDAAGEPMTWEPSPMVLPVSERLKERVSGEEYERRVAEAMAPLKIAWPSEE